MPSLAFASRLEAPAAEVWARATSMEGVNDELAPLLRMTHPPGLERFEGQEVPLGQRLFRSWILALGFLPIDYDDLAFESLGPGTRFAEQSTMMTMRRWRHERVVEALGERACRVVDRLTFEPRLAALGSPLARVVRLLFEHRHERLRLRFGGGPAPSGPSDPGF